MDTIISTETILSRLGGDNVKMGDVRKLAKEIKKNHPLAMELWAGGQYSARMLAVLLLDKNQLDQALLGQMMDDLQENELDHRVRIVDWLMANQLMKSKKLVALIESWEHAESPLMRRLFWYHQARLRWTGKIPQDNADALLDSIEAGLVSAESEVQWAMNFAAGQIGIFDLPYRSRCIELGERVGLYKDEPVPRGCTPNYLPEFIRIEVAKRQ